MKTFQPILLCLLAGLTSLGAALRPGDIAFVRLSSNFGTTDFAFVALVDIDAGETIHFTDQDWTGRGFVSDPDETGEGVESWSDIVTTPAGTIVQMSTSTNLSIDRNETLYAYTGTASDPTFLYALVTDDNWNLWTSAPRGLEQDLTYFALGQINGAPTDNGEVIIDHYIKRDLIVNYDGGTETPITRNQLEWLQTFSQIDSWTYYGGTEAPIDLIIDTSISIDPFFAGLIEFSSPRFLSAEGDLDSTISVRRLYGSAGAVSVNLSLQDSLSNFSVAQPNDFSITNNFYADIMGVAYGGDSQSTSMWAAVTAGSSILTSPDGQIWTATDISPYGGLFDITYLNDRFFAVGQAGTILQSNLYTEWPLDGNDADTDPDGITWTALTSNTSNTLFGIHAAYVSGIGNVLIAVGNDVILRSIDLGQTWVPVLVGSGYRYYSATYDGSRWLATGNEGVIYHSFDGGFSWSRDTSQEFTTARLWDSLHVNGVTYVVGGNGDTLIDQGNGWQPVNSKNNLSQFAVAGMQMAGSDVVSIVGSNGMIVQRDANGNFTVSRLIKRAPSIYDIAGGGGKFVAVGEYGFIYSGSLTQVLNLSATLDGASSDLSLSSLAPVTWFNGETDERHIPFPIADDSTNEGRERIDVYLDASSLIGADIEIGRDKAEVLIFSDDGTNSLITTNYGTFVSLTEVSTSLVAGGNLPNQVSFQVRNTSPRASGNLFVRFTGSNLPPVSLGTVPANSLSSTYTIALPETVQAMELYEVLSSYDGSTQITNEPVFKSRKFINSIYAETNRAINEELPGTLAAGFNINPSPTSGGSTPFSVRPHGVGETPGDPGDEGGGEDAGLILQSIEIQASGSPTTIETGNTIDFDVQATWIDINDPVPPIVEELTPSDHAEADWSDDNSIYTIDDPDTDPDFPTLDGDLVASHPSATYPLMLTITASSIEGAPLDGNDDPIPVTDDYIITINEPAANTDYATWAAANISNASDRDMSDNEDGDSLSNFLEFAGGLNNPEVTDISNFFGTNHVFWSDYDDISDTYTFYFKRPTNIKGVQYTIETSEGDLASFADQLGIQLDSSGGGFETWKYEVTSPSLPIFGRLQVDSF